MDGAASGAGRPRASPPTRVRAPREVAETSLCPRPLGRIMKRAFDAVAAALLLALLSPLFVAVAIAIKLDSRGPVFFCQERIGKDGRPFRIWKFRSMIEGAINKGAGFLVN